jgi:toxin-antitoxin system PIN domain toxin
MKLIDLNVLLYAVNQDAPEHPLVRPWWESAVSGEEPVALCWVVLLGFLRLATSPQVFAQPLSCDQAIAKVDLWLAQPPVRIVQETDEQWRILRGLLAASGSAGNLTTDAHLASLAIAHGAVLVSCNTDFARFPGLRWEHPSGAP